MAGPPDSPVVGSGPTAAPGAASAALLPDPLAVLDPQLRVRGVRALRVVDASAMPRIVGGQTCAPTIMIAEKIADKIRGRKPLPRSTADYYVAGDAPVRGKPLREIAQ